MADPVPAADTVVDNDDAEYLYSETSTGDFRKVEATKFVTSLGQSGDDEGKVATIDENGSVAWETPVIGAMILIETKTLSAASEALFTTSLSTDYDEYIFQFLGLVPGTDNTELQCYLYDDGGTTPLAHQMSYWWANASTTGQNGGDSSAAINLVQSLDANASSAFFGKAELLVTTTRAALMARFHSLASTGASNRHTISGGSVTTSSRLDAVKFFMSSGTMSGKIRLYGVKNA